MAGEGVPASVDKVAPGSTVLGLPSTPAGKEASIIRPFKGCVARKFSCSRESSGPHRESERVWSWGGQQTVGGGLITQKQMGHRLTVHVPHFPHTAPSSLSASSRIRIHVSSLSCVKHLDTGMALFAIVVTRQEPFSSCHCFFTFSQY